MRRQRIGQRGHAGIERAPRGAQRLIRLQHHGEFGEIESADENQRAGAELRGVRLGMREGVADLAQRDDAKPRRQIERRCERRIQARFGWHAVPDWRFQTGITIT
jgi:hypothetical protein